LSCGHLLDGIVADVEAKLLFTFSQPDPDEEVSRSKDSDVIVEHLCRLSINMKVIKQEHPPQLTPG